MSSSQSQPVLASNSQPGSEPSAATRDPLAWCDRCGQRHIEHDFIANVFACWDRRGEFQSISAQFGALS